MLNECNLRLLKLMAEQTNTKPEDVLNLEMFRFLNRARISGVFKDPDFIAPEKLIRQGKKVSLKSTPLLRAMKVSDTIEIPSNEYASFRVGVHRLGFKVIYKRFDNERVFVTRIS